MSEILTDIGEFGLIERLHKLLQEIGAHTPGITLGMGDDAASLRPRPGYELLITCDTLLEGRHYLPHHIMPMDVGRRAMAVNISDIGAMGGSRGFAKELNPFGASIIGGNLTKSEKTVFIDITLIGEVRKKNIMLRSSAQAGDAILVTGYPGQAAAGLKLLQKAKSNEKLGAHPLVQAYNVPSHRAREGHAIARSRKAHAMIDTSDGFLADLGHICQESDVGALLIQDAFPLSNELKMAAVQLDMDPYQLFLQESDDYELIVTCSPENAPHIHSAIKDVSQIPVHEVGKITETAKEIYLKLPDGTKCPISPHGWDHFR